VPVNVLEQWGWPALPISGDGNLQLSATGRIQADAPLKPTVDGELSAVNAQQQQVKQTMRNGVVSGGEGVAPASAPVPTPTTTQPAP
jgi:hypothetical protein